MMVATAATAQTNEPTPQTEQTPEAGSVDDIVVTGIRATQRNSIAVKRDTAVIVDAIRSWASGFIFTTSLPPALTAGALASVRHLKTHPELRAAHQERAQTLKDRFAAAGIPVMPSESHIVPVFVGDPVHTKMISDMLLEDHGIYVQPINYPTVARRTERLRITPSPLHTDADIDHLVNALTEIWAEIGLKRAA